MIELVKYDTNSVGDILQNNKPSLVRGVTPIRKATNVLWVEKFNGTGEVTIEGPIASDLFAQLPKGCIVTHLNTRALMRIDSHLISGGKDKEPKLKVVGSSIIAKSLDRVFRDITVPLAPVISEIPGQAADEEVIFGGDDNDQGTTYKELHTPKEVVRQLMHGLLDAYGSYTMFRAYDILVQKIDYDLDIANSLAYLSVRKTIEPIKMTPTSNVLSAVQGILNDFDIGIQELRNYAREGYNDSLMFIVHGGTDLTGDGGVHLRVSGNSLNNYSSLQSEKSRKNVAIITTKYFRFRIEGESVVTLDVGFFDVGSVAISASFIDAKFENLEEAKLNLSEIASQAYLYGTYELSKLDKDILVVEVDVGSDNPQYEYRRDFNLGDVVGIDSSAFFTPQPLRVIEHVESLNDGVFEAYPVLKSVTDGWQVHAHTKEAWTSWLGDR